MKIGINRWTLPSELSLAESFRMVKRAGFDSIEINIAEDGELRPDSNETEVKAILASSKEAGVQISSVSSGLGWKYPLTSGDEAVRAKGIANTKAALQAAKWLDTDTILLVPGIVSPEISYDDAYTRSQNCLKELAPTAESLAVSIGVENVWNKFLLSPLEFRNYLDEINSTHVGAYFDAGNVLVYGYPDQWIRILGKRIKKVHVKDFKSNIGNITAFCNPLQGNVPWAEVNKALRETGYDEFITAEVEGYGPNPELGLKHICESLRAVFAS